MTFMGNNCGPEAVDYYERQCSHDFIFPQPCVNGAPQLTPKAGDPRVDQGGAPYPPSSPDPACAAETLPSVPPGGARSAATLTDGRSHEGFPSFTSREPGGRPSSNFVPTADASFTARTATADEPGHLTPDSAPTAAGYAPGPPLRCADLLLFAIALLGVVLIAHFTPLLIGALAT